MMFLHGIGSAACSFVPVLCSLPRSIEGLAWNAPGYEGSAPLAQLSPTPRDYASALKALLDALGYWRVLLVGHSLGALFAASFAAISPERVAGLALLSPALGYRVPAGAPLPDVVQARIDELRALGPVAFSDKRSARLVSDPVRKPDVLAAVQRSMAALHEASYAQAVRALGAGDLVADLAAVSAPALVAVGTNDQVTPPDNARIARDAFGRQVLYREIEGAGHALPLEEPNIVASLLGDFAEGEVNG